MEKNEGEGFSLKTNGAKDAAKTEKIMDLSIIIAYHDEGESFIHGTVESIRSTIDVEYEIIIVDDCSEIPLKLDNAIVLRHDTNLGVGTCFDTGIKIAKSEAIFLMGCDVRFIANKWAYLMTEEIRAHPTSLICTSVVHLDWGSDIMTFELSRQNFVYNGATVLVAYGDKEGNRDILHASWLPRFSRMVPLTLDAMRAVLDKYGVDPGEKGSYQVPCILGAAYGVSKSWYNHIDGFWGHRKWGTLEPYISIKSYMMGGDCLTAPHIETAHMFKTGGIKDMSCLAYNSMLICWLLLEKQDKKRLIDWLNHPGKREGMRMIEESIEMIYPKRTEYKRKIKMSFNDYVIKFKLNY